jgi:hypothetical protein
MPGPAEENFRPPAGPEHDKRPEEQHEPNRTGPEPAKTSKLGELVPTEHESGEAAQTAAELFHQAAGLDKLPEAGKSQMAIKATEWQAQRSEGVSRAQNIAFQNDRGEVTLGVQYTNNDGTFFKTAQGSSFRVEPNEKGGFDLRPLGGRGEAFTAVELRVVKDLFSSSRDDLSALFKTRPLTPETVAAPSIDRALPMREVTRPEPVILVPENVVGNQRADAISRTMTEFRAWAQYNSNQVFDAEVSSMRELHRIISNLCTSQPDLSALLQIQGLIARNMGGSVAQRDFGGAGGDLDFRPSGAICTEYGINMGSVLVNMISDFVQRRQAESAVVAMNIAQAAAPVSDVARPQPTRENVPPPPEPRIIPVRPQEERIEPPPVRQIKEEPQAPPEPVKAATPEEEAIPELAPPLEPEPELLPPIEPIEAVVAAEIQNEIAEEATVLQAQESIKSEEDEKTLLEETRAHEEEAERAERELIKQQIKKRDEERRRRYVVKERDTFESIAVKQFKDVRLSKLIYEINKHLLPLRMVRGKQVRELKPRMVIFLPTNAEIEKFRQTAGMTVDLLQAQELLNMQDRSAHSTADAILDLKANATAGDTTPLNVQSAHEGTAETSSPDDSVETESQAEATDSEPVALAAAAEVEVVQQSPPEIPAAVKPEEDDDHVGYTVRLGDTLKSIAIRQPQLLDHSLWVLLAEVNGLSTAVDTSGSPTCKLARGMRLKLPNKSEVEAFRAEKKNPFERS